jgi:ligand-binding sensor domain-containing protein
MRTLLFPILFFATLSGFGQSGPWTLYNTLNSGLPSDAVLAIGQDDNGIMWFATIAGVASFDGTNWTDYTTTNSELPNNYVRDIFIYGNEKWFGTINSGIVKFDDTTWTVYDTSNSGLTDNWILDINMDCAENLWIGTIFGGASRFDRVDQWMVLDTSSAAIIENNVRAVHAADTNDIWLGILGGISHCYNGTTTNYTSSDIPLPGDDVTAIIEDPSGNLWFGVWNNGGPGGLVKYDGTNWVVYDTSNSSMEYSAVYTILWDACDNIWCGGAWLHHFDHTAWTSYEDAYLPDYHVESIYEDCSGAIWVATLEGVARFSNDCSTSPDCSTSSLCVPKAALPDAAVKDVLIYPNPVSDYLTITVDAGLANSDIVVWDLIGAERLSENLTGATTHLDLSDLPPGMYIIQISSPNGSYQQRFIKQ